MELELGRIVDRYQVETLLGEGGMASVYRVRHTQLGSLHALKVLTIPSRSIRERLINEGRVQASLRHPNIVAVTDVIEVDGAPGLVMEYIKGPSLDDLLRQRRLTIEQADHLAEGILRGVAAAHGNDLIHRDLKPANVMLAITDHGLVPKVADFGLVKLISQDETASRTRSGVAMGTPAYMSPEQVRDAKTVDRRADIYALGAILYELVTGHRMFAGTDTLDIFTKVASGQYTPAREHTPDLPERIVHAIDTCIQVDPDDRVPDCLTLLAVWRGETTYGGDDLSLPPTESPLGPFDAGMLMAISSMGDDGMDTPLHHTPSQFPNSSAGPGSLNASQDTFVDMEIAPSIGAAMETIGFESDAHEVDASIAPPEPETSTLPPPEETREVKPRATTPILIAAVVAIALGAAAMGSGAMMLMASQSTTSPAPVPAAPEQKQKQKVADVKPAKAKTEAKAAKTKSKTKTNTKAKAEPEIAPTQAPKTSKVKSKKRVRPAAAPEPEPVDVVVPEPAPEPVPEPAPEPEPAPAPTTATFVSKGDVERVYLQPVGGGSLMPAGEVPPGKYTVQVFWSGGVPTQAMTVVLEAGQTRTITCRKQFKVCK